MNGKRLILSVIVFILATENLFSADNLEEAFDNAKTDGYLRLGYQRHDSENDISLGGKLHFETEEIDGTSVGVALYSTNAFLGKNDSRGLTFFDSKHKAYSILGEAYLKGVLDNSILVIGRQVLDTPFADSDDIGMIPNLFEAYTFINSDIPNTTIIASWLNRGSGIDFDEPEKFSRLNGDHGVQTIGVEYEGLNNTTISGWFYNLKDEAKLSYIELGYSFNMSDLIFDLAGQYSVQNFENSEDTTIVGANISISDEARGFTFASSYNKSSDFTATNGFGGGPFFTNSEHLTLPDAGEGGEIVFYSLEWDLGSIGVDGLSLFVSKADLSDKDGNEGDEVDFILHYDVDKRLSLDIIHSQIDNNNISGDKFDNTRAFINYTF